MKIKELLEKLKNQNPEAKIYIRYPDFEYGVNEYEEIGKIEIDFENDVNIYTEKCWKE